MVKYEESFLCVGYKTPDEFINDFWNKKPLNYTTSNIRKIYCDNCSGTQCEKCFVHDCLGGIYKINPFA